MLGFYNYTVVLTYISLLISVRGIMFATDGHIYSAVVCLALSGLCDVFDGKIARTKKDRTADEKMFGIQIDSLCDLVCFGVLPAVIAYNMGMHSVVGIIVLMFYVLAGMIRLAYFNVQEANRQNQTEECRKYYQGLPITSMSVILPLVLAILPLIGTNHLLSALYTSFVSVGILFITKFNMRKPTNLALAVLIVVVAVAIVVMWIPHCLNSFWFFGPKSTLFPEFMQILGGMA